MTSAAAGRCRALGQAWGRCIGVTGTSGRRFHGGQSRTRTRRDLRERVRRFSPRSPDRRFSSTDLTFSVSAPMAAGLGARGPLTAAVVAHEFDRIDLLPVPDTGGVEFETDAVGTNSGRHVDHADTRSLFQRLALMPDHFFARPASLVRVSHTDRNPQRALQSRRSHGCEARRLRQPYQDQTQPFLVRVSRLRAPRERRCPRRCHWSPARRSPARRNNSPGWT